MTSKFEQKINTVEWLLTDGATGTNLFDMGLMSGDAPELWNENYPEFSKESSWSNINNPEGWIMSYGLGPRFYFLGMPRKLDYVWQYNPYKGRVSSRSWYLSLGVDF